MITSCRCPPWLRPRWDDNADAARSLIGMIIVVAALHIVGWLVLLVIVVPQHLSVGGKAFDIGVGIAAYLLGMRHAFDADHIAAIDNTTRRLAHDARRSLSVGFWFSLGHSSVVFALTLLLALGVRGAVGRLLDDYSSLHNFADLTGTIVSSGFLYVIAAFNLVIFVGIWRTFREVRAGHHDGASISGALESRGFTGRLAAPAMRIVDKPHKMYFVGLLFGLSFDTATEIALLVLTTSGAASGLPWYAILCLPVLFAAGMSLLDAIDGVFMSFTYRWALAKPERKIYYNLVVTGLSILVALIIGTVEIAALLGEKLNLDGAFWNWARGVDLNAIGFIIVGLFVAIWAVAVALRKRRGAGPGGGSLRRGDFAGAVVPIALHVSGNERRDVPQDYSDDALNTNGGSKC